MYKQSMLQTKAEGLLLEECASTNDLAKEWAERGAPEGSFVSALSQTAGRGRQGGLWHSPPGNLYLSVITHLKNHEQLTWVPIAAGLGVCKLYAEQFPKLALRIKWPNDLWVSGRKLGGFLCESVSTQQVGRRTVVVGVGINCVYSPKHAALTATDLHTELAAALGEKYTPITLEELRSLTCDGILAGIQLLREEGSSYLQSCFEDWSSFSLGTSLEWREKQSLCQGQFVGLGSFGELIAKTKAGRLVRLFSESVKKVHYSESI